MSFVNLVSGGLDSTLIGVLAKEENIQHYPLFIDYGQRSSNQEWATCQAVHKALGLPQPTKIDLSGFGATIISGLTSTSLDIKYDAFTPNRNLFFLVMASAYAFQLGISSICIGLLSEEYSLFTDQSVDFIKKAETCIAASLGRKIEIITPLIDFKKIDVYKLSQQKGITGTYSCHTGNITPCGECISCSEFKFEGGK